MSPCAPTRRRGAALLASAVTVAGLVATRRRGAALLASAVTVAGLVATGTWPGAATDAAAVASPVRVMTIGDSITSAQTVAGGADRSAQWPSYRGALYAKLTGTGTNPAIGVGLGIPVDFVGSENGVDNGALACPSTNPGKVIDPGGVALPCDYGTRIGGASPFPLVDPHHEGHNGWTIDQLTTGHPSLPAEGDLRDWLADAQPDVVVFFAGTNDLAPAGGDTPEEAFAQLQTAVREMQKAKPAIRIVVAQISPTQGDPVRNAKIAAFNQRVPDIAHETTPTSPVIVADLFHGYCMPGHPDPASSTTGGGACQGEDYAADGSHPNKDGHAFIARRLGDAMAGAGFLQATVSGPDITGVDAQDMARNTTAEPVLVTGTNFYPGATFSLGAGAVVRSASYRSPTRYELTVDVSPSAAPGVRTLSMVNKTGGSDSFGSAVTITSGSTDPSLKVMVLGDHVVAGLPGNPATHPTYRHALFGDVDGATYQVAAGDAPAPFTGTRTLDVQFVGSQSGIGAGALSVPSASPLADPDHDGHPTATLTGLAALLPARLAAFDPDVVVIHAGYNDLAVLSSPPTTAQLIAHFARYGPILDAILDRNPYARVVVTDLTPSNDARIDARIDAVNAAMAARLAPVIDQVITDHALPADQILFRAGTIETQTLGGAGVTAADLAPDAPGVYLTGKLAAVAHAISGGAAAADAWSLLGTQRPAPPANPPVATPGPNRLTVAWQDSPFNFDAGPILRYVVTARPAGGGAATTVTVAVAGGHDPTSSPPQARSIAVDGLSGGTAYSVTVRAESLRGSSMESVATSATPTIAPPSVDAGPARTIDFGGTASLDGAAAGHASVAWSLAGGPGAVRFANPAAIDTTATFSRPGAYTLRLTATNTSGSVADVTTVTVRPVVPPPDPESGYFVLEADGDLYAFGGARAILRRIDPQATEDQARGATISTALRGRAGAATAVAIETTADGKGLWVLLEDGRILPLGNAPAARGVQAATLTEVVAGQPERVAAMAGLSNGDLWVFTTAGRVIPQFGSLPAAVSAQMDAILRLDLVAPIIDAKPTTDGTGVYAQAADGGVFTYGAPFLGSVYDAIAEALGVPVGSVGPDLPVVGITVDPDGDGYWVVAADGGVFTRRAPFRGALPALVPYDRLFAPVNGMVPFGDGYLLVAGDGGVFVFSNQPFSGSASGLVDTTVVGVAPV